MRRLIFTSLTAVLILSLVLVGCKPAATPTPTPVPPTPTKAAPTPTPAPPTPTKPPAVKYEDEWGVVKVEKGDTIKIGFAAGLSGAGIDVLGLDELRGAELAVKDKPEIKGFKVELVVEDEMCSAEGGQTVANKMVANPQIVAIVGHMCSSSCRPASKIYEQHHYTMVSPSCTAPSLTNPALDGTEIFNRVCWNDAIQGPAAANFVKNVLGIDRAATIHDGSPYAEQLGQEFAKAFEALGGKIVAREAVNVGDTDMRPVLTRIKAGNPGLIYWSGFVAEGGYLAAQRADVGMENVIFMGADGIKADEFIKAAGDMAEGVYASAGDFAEAGPALPKFLEAYEKTYGEKPIAPFHAHAYDAYMVIANAIEKVSELDAEGNLLIGRKKLRDAIRATKDYQGLSGKIGCDANGDCGLGSVAFSVVKGGQWVPVEKPAAAPPAEEAKCVLKSVEKVDDYTVRFTFHRPHAPFLAQLASAMMPMVSPAAGHEVHGRQLQEPGRHRPDEVRRMEA
jgi:branched-chain amino acid transport system substrate-binding protein